jgi:hypothetical protein
MTSGTLLSNENHAVCQHPSCTASIACHCGDKLYAYLELLIFKYFGHRQDSKRSPAPFTLFVGIYTGQAPARQTYVKKMPCIHQGVNNF